MSTEQPELTRTLVDHLAGLRFEDLPADVVVGAQAAVLDHLACLTYGMDQPWLTAVRKALLPDAAAGGGTAPVLLTGRRTTAGDAAFVNGTAAHGFELDDIYYRTHPGSVVISAALACLGGRRDGRELIAAITAGYELIGRVARSIGVAHSDLGFHTMGVVGPFGAAAAAAHICGFDADRSNSAVGIAASFGSGIKAFTHGPGMVKRLHAGQAARNGVLAADLAAAGFDGPKQPLEGRFGFCRIFAPDDSDMSRLTEGLGEQFVVADVYLKPYSCCGALHGVINAAEMISAEHEFALADIESVLIGTTAHGMQKSQPHPVDVMTTQYSLESGAVLGLLGRAGDPTSFRPEVVRTGEAGRVLACIQVAVDAEAQSHFPGSMDSRITMRLRDGRELSAYGIGHAQGVRNLDAHQRWQAAIRKFHRLTDRHFSLDERENVLAAVRGLADGADTEALIGMFAPERLRTGA
jgi:2-methylcitrate dehydratase PrpD